jgi:DNA primase
MEMNSSDFFKELVKVCQILLLHDPIAEPIREYLKLRVHQTSWNKYSFGYFPPNDNLSSLYSFFDKKELEAHGILYRKTESSGEYDNGHFCNHNLIIPYFNEYDEVIGLIGRSLLSEDSLKEKEISKYKYSKKSYRAKNLFGLNLARQHIINSGYAIICEGQFDVISAHEVGLNNVVGVGSASLGIVQAYLLAKYTDKIYLMYDNDNAGKLGKEHTKKRYGDVFDIKTIGIPGGYKDFDEFIKKETNIKWKVEVIEGIRSLNG